MATTTAAVSPLTGEAQGFAPTRMVSLIRAVR